MNEQTNTKLVQKAYAAFGSGDVSGLLHLIASDVVWHFPQCTGIPWAGTFRRHEGVVQFLGSLAKTADIENFDPSHFFAQGDRVVVLGHERLRIKSTQRSCEIDWAHSFILRGGVIAEFREYTDTAVIAGAFDPT